MIQLTHPELESIIESAVDKALERQGHPPCPLLDVGISDDMHKMHHSRLESFHKDINKIKVAFIGGILVTLSGGILGLLWLGFRTKIKLWFGA